MTKLSQQGLSPPSIARVKILERDSGSQESKSNAYVKGIISTLDAANIPDDALADSRNTRFRYDKTIRRAGRQSMSPSAPDGNKVLKLYQVRNSTSLSTIFLRFSKSSLWIRRGDYWLQISPASGSTAISGEDSNKFSIANLFDQVVFTNGAWRLKLFDAENDTYSDLNSTQAPWSKFCASFYNRAIAVRRMDGSDKGPVTINWSATFPDISVWDNSENIEAGTDYLIQTPAEASDFCTGVIGFTNVLVLPKERSIWAATKNPIASAPFNFYNAVPGQGLDCSYSVAVIPSGIVFVDKQTKGVFVYTIDGSIERIGGNVDTTLISRIVDVNEVFGMYDRLNGEYRVSVDGELDYVYNFGNKAWSIDDGNVTKTCFYYNDNQFSIQRTIAELEGTIDLLAGTIADLAFPLHTDSNKIYIGLSTGEILEEDDEFYQDADNINGQTDFLASWISKALESSESDKEVRLEQVSFTLNTLVETAVSIYYSVDEQASWVLSKTVTASIGRGVMIVKPNVTAARIFVKLVSASGQVQVLSHNFTWAHAGIAVTL